MLLALCTLPSKVDEYPRLSMIPDKLSAGVTPILLEYAIPTESAVQYLSPDEGFVVRRIEDGYLEIEPLAPAKLYLTPNLPSRPGFSVNKIKFKVLGEHRYHVEFNRTKGWEVWQPHLKVF